MLICPFQVDYWNVYLYIKPLKPTLDGKRNLLRPQKAINKSTSTLFLNIVKLQIKKDFERHYCVWLWRILWPFMLKWWNFCIMSEAICSTFHHTCYGQWWNVSNEFALLPDKKQKTYCSLIQILMRQPYRSNRQFKPVHLHCDFELSIITSFKAVLLQLNFRVAILIFLNVYSEKFNR